MYVKVEYYVLNFHDRISDMTGQHSDRSIEMRSTLQSIHIKKATAIGSSRHCHLFPVLRQSEQNWTLCAIKTEHVYVVVFLISFKSSNCVQFRLQQLASYR